MIDLTGYKLTFDDEFDARSISQTGAGTTWADIRPGSRYDANSDIGFGQSSFLDASSGYDPFNVSGGALKITAAPPHTTTSGYPGSWQSGLLTTQGNFSQTYGYFEIRANFSAQPGAWDAFWLMPNQQIPDPNKAGNWQELDVVEHYGAAPQSVYSTIHTTDPQNGIPWQQNRQVYSEMSNPTGYHTYGVNWQPDYISFYVDGNLVGKQPTPSDMHSPMYLMVDLATQNASGNDANVAGVPISSYIDYVRVYSNAPNAVGVAQQQVSSPDGHDPGLYGATATASTALATGSAAASGNGDAANIARLYYGLLDRAPDASGLSAFASNMQSGWHLGDVAQAILGSAEYRQLSTGVSDAQFVNSLYADVLGRTGDTGGVQGWNAFLSQGGSRVAALQGFTDSFEFQSKYAGQSNGAYVEALYESVFGRHGDASGAQSWTSQLDSHGLSRIDVAHAFAASPEFQNKYVAPSAASFVDSVYENALGRHAEASGLASWTSAIAQGTSRADVAIGIAESTEAQQHLLSQLQHNWPLS